MYSTFPRGLLFANAGAHLRFEGADLTARSLGQIAKMIAKADGKSSGGVNFEEFVRMVKGSKAPKKSPASTPKTTPQKKGAASTPGTAGASASCTSQV